MQFDLDSCLQGEIYVRGASAGGRATGIKGWTQAMNAPNFGALFETADVAQNNVGLGSGGPRLIQIWLENEFLN